MKLKNLLINLSVLAVTAILMVFLGEIAIRLIMPQQVILYNESNIWQPDDYLSFIHVPQADTRVNTGEKEVHFVTDENGFRINSREDFQRNVQSPLKVLTLGDSFLEALQVENDSTMNEILRRKILEKHQQEVYIANTGVGGYGPNHYYLLAKKELDAKDYDLGIVYFFLGNDLIDHFDTLLTPRRIKIKKDEGIAYQINDYLEKRSHLFVLLKNSSQTILSKVGLTPYYFPPIFLRSEAEAPIWENTANICRKIQDEFDNRHIPVLFVFLPTSYQVHKEVFDSYVAGFDLDPASIDMLQPNKIMQAEFEKRGLSALDALSFMTARGKRLYGYVDRHFNEEGHRTVADFIFPAVDSLLFSGTAE